MNADVNNTKTEELNVIYSDTDIKAAASSTPDPFRQKFEDDCARATSDLGGKFTPEDIKKCIDNIAASTPAEKIQQGTFASAVQDYLNDDSKPKLKNDQIIAGKIMEALDPNNLTANVVSDQNDKNVAANTTQNNATKPDNSEQSAPSGGPSAPNYQGMAAGGGALLGSVVSAAASLFVKPAQAYMNALNKDTEQRETVAANHSAIKNQEKIDKGFANLNRAAEDLGTTPSGPEKDAKTTQFCKDFEKQGELIKKLAKKDGLAAADPGNRSLNKPTQGDLTEAGDANSTKMNEVAEKAAEGVKGDPKNESKVKQAHEAVAEMMQAMINMLKNLFKGFSKDGPSAAPKV